MSAKIKQVYFNVSMINGHDGLTEVVLEGQKKLPKEFRVSPRQLTPGDLLVFINSSRNKLKVLGANNVLAYVRLPRGEKLDLQAIQYIPNAFDGTNVDFSSAIKEMVEKYFERKRKREIDVIAE